ncbi:hypothetical protein Mycsm_01747 [Mycobacterium sp. JS623]|uniref:hypothetical protein n=1 Tax=Mycobacterium sp. JS623 TaxID=212767 RepID=UPI0002A59406|nr:hypothetical protein [Mycobacterium sp. JS623]AGB22140.1 hypothetical protein Mycsm_01747 [Mycobacterium sp. JS623]
MPNHHSTDMHRSVLAATRALHASRLSDQIAEAAAKLSDFIEEMAHATADEVGFGYVLRSNAPSTYPALVAAYKHSLTTGAPLPISSENSDAVIYTKSDVNFALRFWHDINHVRHGLSFDLVDELELSLWHLGELEKAGHQPGSLVWRLLHADLTGQAYVQAFARRFPFDQRRFVTGCVTAGFDGGLLHELRNGTS